jgi:tetrahydromethanopterin S-methyltransferase subunit A
MGSVDLLENFNNPEYLKKIALVGKDVTENVGIEKIVLNVVSNPRIRFIILCGKESEGHFVGQGIKAVIENGMDENKKIIGAKGPIPYLKNITKDQVEIFRKQVKVVDLTDCEDIPTIIMTAEECDKKSPGVFESGIKIDEIKTIVADYDPSKEKSADGIFDEGWFTISIDRNKQLIIVEHYVGYGADAKLNCKIVGKTSEEIIGTLVKHKLIKGLYHAGYVGKELAKAEMALKNNLPYEQEGKLE